MVLDLWDLWYFEFGAIVSWISPIGGVEGQDIGEEILGSRGKWIFQIFTSSMGRDMNESCHDDDNQSCEFGQGEEVGRLDAPVGSVALDWGQGHDGQGCHEFLQHLWWRTPDEEDLAEVGGEGEGDNGHATTGEKDKNNPKVEEGGHFTEVFHCTDKWITA